MDTEVLADLNELNIVKEDYLKFLQECKDWEILFNNRYFKRFILKDYCEDEPVRLTSLLAIVEKDQKEKVYSALEAVSHLKSHLAMKKQSKLIAEQKLAEVEEQIKELEESLNNTQVVSTGE